MWRSSLSCKCPHPLHVPRRVSSLLLLLLKLRAGVLCISSGTEAQHGVGLGAGYGGCYFSHLVELKKNRGCANASLLDSTTNGDCSDLCPRLPVTGSANGELGEGLGQELLVNPDDSQPSMGR